MLPFFWQCSDFIDVEPENSVTFTNYFNDENDAEALLTELQIQARNVFSRTWNSNIGIPTHPYFYGWAIPNMLGKYSCTYSWSLFAGLVYQSNLILDNAHRFKVKKEVLEPYLLQAHFMKGMAYFYMAMIWGEAPIFPNSTTFKKVPKSTMSQLLDEAEKNALEAMKLPVFQQINSGISYKRMKQYGCKGSAAALLAYLYAWRAGVENEKQYWEKAESYCTMIIEGQVGSYSLAYDPEEVCTQVMKGDSQESIWEIYGDAAEEEEYAWDQYGVGFPVINTGDYYPGSFATPCLAREDVKKMYPVGDLRRNSYYWAVDSNFIYMNRINDQVIPSLEPGDDVVITYDLDKIANGDSWLGINSFGESFLYKFRYPYYVFNEWIQQPLYKGLVQNKIIYRLADIYLLRAECRAHQNKHNAVEDLNIIRARAYGNLKDGVVINQAKAQEYSYPSAYDKKQGLERNILLAIFREREKELLNEGHRYYDIVRFGMCFINGQDSYDYIREEISPAYKRLTDQDIKDGALFSQIEIDCFKNNDLIRQNKFWNRKIQ